MDILTKSIQFEEVIKGSRFLSELIPCDSQAAARELIKAQKAKYADATHVVHAFVIGPGAEVMGMSDDGEPSGTAGRPVLDVLKGRKCTNTVLTVTRWFGGTLLGTGGLVKAYSGGAKQVIEKVPDALSIYIVPPSMEELERRIRERGTEDEETILKRMSKARQEVKEVDMYKHVVCNDNLDEAVKEIRQIILDEMNK